MDWEEKKEKETIIKRGGWSIVEWCCSRMRTSINLGDLRIYGSASEGFIGTVHDKVEYCPFCGKKIVRKE